MRIVMDLQGAQLSGIDGAAERVLAFAAGVARQAGGHELWLLLNSALGEQVPSIRRRFDALLAPSRVLCFDPLTPCAARQANNAERLRASGAIRAHVIAQLGADVVIVTSLFAGLDEDAVTALGPLDGPLTAVLLHARAPAADPAATSAEQEFYRDQHAALGRASLVITEGVSEPGEPDTAPAVPTLALGQAGDAGSRTNADWDHAARQLLGTLEQQCLQRRTSLPQASLHKKRRLAFVSPLPPERTGIADYAVQLLPALLEYFDVELVIAQPVVSLPAALASVRLRDASWFAENAHLYDQILYQVGNSPFHSYIFPLLQKHPGVVVLHDFFLSSVLAYEQMTGAMPNAWANALFHSHGYHALRDSQLPDNHENAMSAFPCNLEVLEDATGIIVHSDHALTLARQWYGPRAGENWSVVPLPRSAPEHRNRDAARAALGIAPQTFLVCSFGYIGPTKLTHVLLRAWIASTLHAHSDCTLVLVGANHGGAYGDEIAEMIDAAGAGARIRIAGWSDELAYKQYLQAADLGVQLRSISRGETSAAVLDCMNYGLATVVNANGSMAALPADAVWRLPDVFDGAELVCALETLHDNAPRRTLLGTRAADLLETQYRPAHCAALYRDALDRAERQAGQSEQALIGALAALPTLCADEHVLQQLASSIARVPRALAPRQLLVDVTAIANYDLKTGIERVVRTQLLELLRLPDSGWRIEPVYLSTQGNRWHYRYARTYTSQLLGIVWPPETDPVVDVQAGDVYYSADYSPTAVAEAARAGLYADWRRRGVELNFLVHDLLPVLRPEFFPPDSGHVHARWLRCIAGIADRLIGISAAVGTELTTWLQQHAPADAPKDVAVLHHGADIGLSLPQLALPTSHWPLLSQLVAKPTFLMVGTIEPRKGHLQTIGAFEQLWQRGLDVNLVIVGGEGWKGLPAEQRRTIPAIISRLSAHAELGKRLFWLEGIDDAYLQQIYRASTCLIASSEGEGFGLPLIEAASHGIALIARDLPVFCEVAQQNASYFSGLDDRDLADAVQAWLRLKARDGAPTTAGLRWNTWRDNATQLLALLGGTSDQRPCSATE